jgi:RNA polymerase sigma-70 factor (ECF subfamily)
MKTAEQGQQELTRRLCADLAGSFERLMETYQDRLYSFAWRLSGNPQDAEEIVQDAFVRAYRALQSYPAGRIEALALRPWLYRITLNVFRNRVRGRRLAVVSMDDRPEDHADQEPAAPEHERPEVMASQAELRGELAAAVAALPERYRTAVVLRYVEGLSYAELAETLSQPVGTVKANVHRGIGQLRRQMMASMSGEQGEVAYEQ